MPETLNGDIGAAVDRAATAVSGGTTATTEAPSTSTSTPAKQPTPAPSSSTPAGGSPSPAPAAASGSEAAPTTAGKTQAPATGATDEDGEIIQDQGWLNLDKRRTILSNARTKAQQQARETILEQELGLPKGVNLQSVRTHLQMLGSDAVAYHRQLGENLRRRGLLPPEGASTPPPTTVQTPPAAATPRPRPQPDLVFNDGRRAYSEEAQADLLEWQSEQLTAQFNRALEERLGPMQETHEIVQAEAVRNEAHAVAAATLEEASTWHRFGEFKKQIAELMVADRRVTVFSAYNRLLQAALKNENARVAEESRTATLDELSRRPGRDLVPGSPAATVVDPAARKRGGSLDDLLTDAVTRSIAKHSST